MIFPHAHFLASYLLLKILLQVARVLTSSYCLLELSLHNWHQYPRNMKRLTIRITKLLYNLFYRILLLYRNMKYNKIQIKYVLSPLKHLCIFLHVIGHHNEIKATEKPPKFDYWLGSDDSHLEQYLKLLQNNCVNMNDKR